MKRKIKYLLLGLILMLCLSLFTSCSLLDFTTVTTSIPASSTSVTTTTTTVAPPNTTWTLPATQTQNPELSSFVEVVNKVKPSVVAINAEVTVYDIFNREYTQEVAGSGWVLNGFIVTNNHVIDGAKNISVTLEDGTVIPATIKGADALSDLAVLKVDRADLPSASVGDSTNLQVGQWVMAIGNALGEGISATQGIVSRTGASITVDTGQTLTDLIQTSAAINPGNSGGPLVDMAGDVIGITSAKLAALGVEGMGYAISTRTALPIIESLVKIGYVIRPYLGINVQTVNALLVLRYGLAVDYGAYINSVGSGSPAEIAGLQAGDIIVEFNGKEVSTDYDCLTAIRSAQIGQTVDIVYWRGNSQNTTQATLIEIPAP